MLSDFVTVSAKGNGRIKLNIYPGHYATSHAHVDSYINMTEIRSSSVMAAEAASELANHFMYTKIDTIICLEYTQIIGAYVARELTSGRRSINSGADIHLITPEINSSNQLTFNSDTQKHVTGRNVLLLISTVSTGRSLSRAAECIAYYGGKLAGIGSIFSAIDESDGLPVKTIFHRADFGEYNSFPAHDCPLCKNGRKLDGLVTTGGYTQI